MNGIKALWACSTFLLAGCSLAASTTPSKRPDSAIKLRVATYNVRIGSDLSRIQENLRLIGADVICLQEISTRRARLRKLAEALGMNYLAANYGKNWRNGLAVLARGKLKLVKVFTMPKERNFGLAAEVAVKGRKLNVLSIHLKSLPRPLLKGFFKSMGSRSQQAKQIAEFAKRSALPVIVAGDCNTLPLTPAYVALSSALRDCCTATGTSTQPTISIDRAGYRIDHVFVRGPWRIASCKVLPLAGSDHKPVAADLELIDVPTTTSKPAKDRPVRQKPSQTRK